MHITNTDANFFYINNLLHGVYRQAMVATFETTWSERKEERKEWKWKWKMKRSRLQTRRKIFKLLNHKKRMHLDWFPRTWQSGSESPFLDSSNHWICHTHEEYDILIQ